MTNIIKSSVIIFCLVFLYSCKDSSPEKSKNFISDKVDATNKTLNDYLGKYKIITSLDHHRMAKETGVYTPPSIATIFSDAKINSELIHEYQEAAIDLPFKILCYADKDTTGVSIAYTSAEFISKRHNIPLDKLKNYNHNINNVLSHLPTNLISSTDTKNISKDFGIVKIQSDFDFDTTIANLKKIILSQGDTRWFADIDFSKEAQNYNFDIRPTKLLLFGGPAPGGKAMVTTPKIGLDAFCQKLLVYQDSQENIIIAYNDIVAFSELYYKRATKPQKMINQRLKQTFKKAITKQK